MKIWFYLSSTIQEIRTHSLKTESYHDANFAVTSGAAGCRYASLAQIMACRLIGAKPLSKPMLHNCSATSDDKVCTTTTLAFQCDFSLLRPWERPNSLARSEQIGARTSVNIVLTMFPICMSSFSPCRIISLDRMRACHVYQLAMFHSGSSHG